MMKYFIHSKVSVGVQFSGLITLTKKCHRKLLTHSKLALLTMATILATGAWVAPTIQLEILPFINFFNNSSLMSDLNSTDSSFLGISVLPISIESTSKDTFKDRKLLEKLLQIEEKIKSIPGTKNTFSIAKVVASSNSVLFSGSGNSYSIPYASSFVSTVLEEAEKAESSKNLVTPDYKIARIIVNVEMYNTPQLKDYFKRLNEVLRKETRNSSLQYELPNTTTYYMSSYVRVLHIQLLSVSIIYFVIFLLMCFVFRSLKAGFIAVIPNFFPLAGIVLLMYALKIPFFPMTFLVLAGVLGLAVDDTIHIMFSYKRHLKGAKNLDEVVSKVITAQFRPVTITSITLIVGVLVLSFSSLKTVMLFSLLMAFGTLLAWVADLAITPFLLRKFRL